MNSSLPKPSLIVANLETLLRSQVSLTAHLCADTRLIQDGDVFMAYPVGSGEGFSDNRVHIPAALNAGAKVVLYESSAWDEDQYPQARAALVDERCIPVSGLAEIAGELANRWYRSPSSELNVIGITGTNGKTTISHWIAQALGQIEPTAVIGTLGVGVLGHLNTTGFTTPDAPRVHRVLSQLRDEKIKSVAMEVSSHALDQGRVNGVQFKTAVFTNLTQDHLDYHGDMSHYEAAKKRLMLWPGLANIVINISDPVGRSWLSELIERPDLKIWIYGTASDFELLNPNLTSQCESILVDEVQPKTQGLELRFAINGHAQKLSMSIIGDFNVSNALAVLAVLLASGVSEVKAIKLIGKLHSVPGRMEIVNPNDLSGHPLMVIDFAHTPDALKKTLLALRPITNIRGGKLVCIFGCGGNRDAGKRPQMGAIASELADEVVVTSDNPRFEDPELIIDQIFEGISSACRPKALRYADRASAILASVKNSGAADVLLVAGKGHETTQEIAGKKIPFSDADHIRLALGGTL